MNFFIHDDLTFMLSVLRGENQIAGFSNRNPETELNTAVAAGVFNEDDATDVKYQLNKAVQQSRKPGADKKSILDHFGRAGEIVCGVSKTVTSANALGTALGQAAEMVQKLF